MAKPALSALPKTKMDNKYVIVMQCYDVDRKNPYPDEVEEVFDDATYARYQMLCCVLDELDSLNGILEDGTFPELRFIATMEDEKHDVIIQAWDGPDYRPVTCYDMVSVEDLLLALNWELKKTHGDQISVEIKACTGDDGSINYYYSSARNGDSNSFTKATAAYISADAYLKSLSE